jgi:hypothetical protein
MDGSPRPRGRYTLRSRLAGVSASTALVIGLAIPVLVGGIALATTSISPGECNPVEACSTTPADAGAISGTVTNGSTPLQGICIYVLPGGGSVVANNWKPDAVTAADGTYTIGDLPGGYYAIEFAGGCMAGVNYAPVWYGGSTSESSSPLVGVVVGRTTSGIDAVMTTAGGSIGGVVTDTTTPTPNPLPGVCVYAFLPGGFPFQPLASTTTGLDGSYVLDSLATGSYDVWFDPTCESSKTSQYVAQGFSDVTDATPVPVTEGGPIVSPIDAALATATSPTSSYGTATISGTVVSVSEPGGVSGVCVYAYVHGATGSPTSEANTNSSGMYTLSFLGTGSYDIEFDPSCGGQPYNSYDIAWANNTTSGASTRAGAVAVNVTSQPQTVTGIGVTLSNMTGTISGTVTNGSVGVSGVCVYAAEPGFPFTALFASLTQTASDGTYSVASVPVGTYQVLIDPSCGQTKTSTYAMQWYDGTVSGAADQSGASTVTVPASPATTVDAALGAGASIAGTLTVPSGLTDMAVSVFPHGGTSIVAQTTFGFLGGPFSFSALPAGSYDVEYTVYSASFLQSVSWYAGSGSGALEQSGAMAVAVSGGGSASNVDGGFGEINGTAVDAVSHTGVAGVAPLVFVAGTSNFAEFAPSTDSNGNYEAIIEAGSFNVSFSEYNVYATQWFNGTASGATMQSGASTVTVTAGATTPGIDATMVHGAKITGFVTDTFGDQVSSVCVNVYPSGTSPAPDWSNQSYFGTAGTPNYSIIDLPPGSYNVQFDPTCDGRYDPGYPPVLYGGALPTTITLTAGQTRTNVDYVLPNPPETTPLPYTPVTPTRICDTRPAGPGIGANQCNGEGTTRGTLGAGGVRTITVPSLPASTSAVVLNVTVADTTASSFLTAWPTGSARPNASNLNWATPGTVVPNLVDVALGPSNQVSFFNLSGSADLIVDLQGYVAPSTAGTGLYNPLTPARICDTRAAGPGVADNQCNGNGTTKGTLGAGGVRTIQVTGMGGVPASGVAAVVLNVTVADTTASSFLTAWPTGSARPNASNLNWRTGEVVPNRVIVPVGSGGQVSLFNASGSTDVIVDVGGWFTNSSNPSATGSLYEALVPARVCDTRGAGPGVPANQCDGYGPTARTLGTGSTLTSGIVGLAGVPAGATAVVANVTVTDASAPSFLTVWPDKASRPNASDLNWIAGDTVPNLVVVALGNDGGLDAFNASGSVDVIMDVQGYYMG